MLDAIGKFIVWNPVQPSTLKKILGIKRCRLNLMMATEQKNDFDDEAFDMVKKDFQKVSMFLLWNKCYVWVSY